MPFCNLFMGRPSYSIFLDLILVYVYICCSGFGLYEVVFVPLTALESI